MAYPVSIKQRILRRIATVLSAADGVGTARLWDVRPGSSPIPAADALVVAGVAAVATESQGSAGYYTMTLPVTCFVRILQDEEDTLTTTERICQLQRAVVAALHADPFWLDVSPAAGVRLAIDTRLVNEGDVQYDDGATDATVTIEVDYQVSRENPAVGPGVAAIEE